MRLYGYNDLSTQGLHLTSQVLTGLNQFTVGDLESQPLILSVIEIEIDACVPIIIYDDATKSIICQLEAVQTIGIAEDSQTDLILFEDATQQVCIKDDGSVILTLGSNTSQAEAILIFGEDATQNLSLTLDANQTLEISADASVVFTDLESDGSSVLTIGADADASLIIEEPCE